MSIKTDKIEDTFNHLVQNGLDFLAAAIEEIEAKPKYSVIHFCSGVEIFLKARLLLEHWTLIIDKNNKELKFEDLKQGKIPTIGVDKAIHLINTVIGESIDDKSRNCFIGLSQHRNRLVHFFQSDFHEAIPLIVGEEYRAWYYLHNLIADKWKAEFVGFQQQIKKLDGEMKGLRKYLTTKFESIEPVLKEKEQAGISILECDICGYEAAIIRQSSNIDILTQCLVCDSFTSKLQVQCLNCKKVSYFRIGESIQYCLHCGEEFTKDYLLESTFVVDDIVDSGLVMDDIMAALGNLPDYSENFVPAYCLDCRYDIQPTVIYVNEKWQCLNCNKVHEPRDLFMCEWCGNPMAGFLEDDSYTYGCELFCDGSIGNSILSDD